MPDPNSRRRSRRLELRTTDEERLRADRQSFELDPVARVAWDELNARTARQLPGLASLFRRPLSFGD